MIASEADEDEERTRVRFRLLAVSFIIAILLVAARLLLLDELQTPYFLTGWITAAVVVCFAVSWWFHAEEAGLHRRLSNHLAFSLLLLTAFAVHVNFRLPNGVLDWILSSWLLIAVASLVFGALRPSRGWLMFHVALSYGLATASLFHGVHVHAHGLLAHLLLER